MLFTLRNVDHLELIGQAVTAESLDRTLSAGSPGGLADADLAKCLGSILMSSRIRSRFPRVSPRLRHESGGRLDPRSLERVRKRRKKLLRSNRRLSRRRQPPRCSKHARRGEGSDRRHLPFPCDPALGALRALANDDDHGCFRDRDRPAPFLASSRPQYFFLIPVDGQLLARGDVEQVLLRPVTSAYVEISSIGTEPYAPHPNGW
jgi:hypothetical protein